MTLSCHRNLHTLKLSDYQKKVVAFSLDKNRMHWQFLAFEMAPQDLGHLSAIQNTLLCTPI